MNQPHHLIGGLAWTPASSPRATAPARKPDGQLGWANCSWTFFLVPLCVSPAWSCDSRANLTSSQEDFLAHLQADIFGNISIPETSLRTSSKQALSTYIVPVPVPVPAYRTFDPRNTVLDEIPHSYRPRKSPRRASTCHQRKLGQSEIVSAQEHRLRRRRRRHGAARRPVLCAWLCELWIPYYDCGGWNLGVWQEYLLASESAGPQL